MGVIAKSDLKFCNYLFNFFFAIIIQIHIVNNTCLEKNVVHDSIIVLSLCPLVGDGVFENCVLHVMLYSVKHGPLSSFYPFFILFFPSVILPSVSHHIISPLGLISIHILFKFMNAQMLIMCI